MTIERHLVRLSSNMNHSYYTRQERQFEEYLRAGINAVKSGQIKLAQSLLNRALLLNGTDARPYVWLSATTENPQEQKEFLEQAFSIDPHNAEARRGLAILNGKIDKAKLLEVGHNFQPGQSSEIEDAQGKVFQCPKCGGRMTYAIDKQLVCCEYCGYVRQETHHQDIYSVADQAEKVLDFVIPTTDGYRWVSGQHHLSCGSCGAISILPKNQKSQRCPYCGSNQLTDSIELRELIDPHVIALIKIDRKEAMERVKKWMRRGLFTYDNLINSSKRIQLNPAYYSFWTFDGISEVHWSCEVLADQAGDVSWESRHGVQSHVFNDVLVSGVKAIDERDLASISPFDLENVEKFNPEFLAGWSTILYDRPISDASIIARKLVSKQFRPQIYQTIEIGHKKRNLQIGTGKWTDMTYKHILLPIWVGIYKFKGKSYRILLNGQNGKISGQKPRDSLKLGFTILIVFMLVFLLVIVFMALTRSKLPT